MNIFPSEKKLGFGLMRLPLTDPDDRGSVDMEMVKRLADIFLERGFTYFDTAWMYCRFRSEEAVREALSSRHPRESYTLADKLHYLYMNEPADRDRIFREQLQKTGVDYFDYYLLHDVGSDAYKAYERLDCFRWLEEKKAQGLVRHVGISFHDSADMLERILTEHPELEFVQLQVNYLDWDNEGIQSRRCCETARRHGKPIVVMEPVKGGALAKVPASVERRFKDYAPEMSVPSWALRFAAGVEGVAMVLSGMSSIAQVEENTAIMTDFRPLNEEEQRLVREAAADINGDIAVPCTGCAYCTDGCPQSIPIPGIFGLYNNDQRDGRDQKRTGAFGYYERLTLDGGKASECIGCGACESVCPQHLPVRELMKTVAARFEGKNN